MEAINTVNNFSKFKGIFDFVDAVREFKLDLKLPQFVVIGAQSTGKSSVLERLMGMSILPRGTGTVTRCPLDIRIRENKDLQKTRVTIDSIPVENLPEGYEEPFPGGEFENEEQTQEAIAERMRLVSQGRKAEGGFSFESVVIKVEGKNLPTLSVIDLPGIITDAGKTEQGQKEVEMTQKIASHFCSQDNSIVLLVLTAGAELRASPASTIIDRYDKDRKRTFNVVTRVDTIAKGESLLELLNSLNSQYVALRNHNSKDEDEKNFTPEQVSEKEKQFFLQNKDEIPSQSWGIYSLMGCLQPLLANKIMESLPGLQDRISKNIDRIEQGLKELGEAIPNDPIDKSRFMSRYFARIKDSIKRGIEGYDRDTKRNILQELRKIFDEFHATLKKKDTLTEQEREDELTYIQDQIDLHSGVHKLPFTSTALYEEVLLKPLKKMIDPCNECVEDAADLVKDFGSKKSTSILSETPFGFRIKLLGILIHDSDSVFQSCFKKAMDHIKLDLHTQLENVFTHKNIEEILKEKAKKEAEQKAAEQKALSNRPAIYSHMQASTSADQVDEEEEEDEDEKIKSAKLLLQHQEFYRKDVIGEISNFVPRTILYFFTKVLIEDIEMKLSSLNGNSDLLDLLKEEEEKATKRASFQRDLGAYKAVKKRHDGIQKELEGLKGEGLISNEKKRKEKKKSTNSE